MGKYLKRGAAALPVLVLALLALTGMAAAQEDGAEPDTAAAAEAAYGETVPEEAVPEAFTVQTYAAEDPDGTEEPEPETVEPDPEPAEGFVEIDGAWYYYDDGKTVSRDIVEDDTGVVWNTGRDTWWYVEDSLVRTDYTGVEQNSYGWWYVKDGKVDFGHNGVDENRYGWWYIVGGKVQFGYTGVADYANDYGWWYIKNGKVDFSKNSVEQNSYGWWYVRGGQVRFGYTGVADYANNYGWWYVNGGKVDFSCTSVEENRYGWWRVVGGKVDFSCNSVEENRYGWWYLTGGQVQFGYTGVANYANDCGWWYIKNGKVDFSKNSVEQNNYGWWYVLGGKVNFGYTGVADYANDYGWWYLKDGKVSFSYTGVADNRYGTWYVKSGKVDFSKTGQVTVLGVRHTVSGGQVMASVELTQAEKLSVIQSGKGTTYSSSLVYLANTSPEAIDFVYLYPELYPIHYEEDYDLTAEAHQNTVPLLIQWDMRWGYVPYGGSCLGLTGCGALSLSMVALYLLDDPSMTPSFIAQYAMNNGYYATGVGTSWDLYNVGCDALGLNSERLDVTEAAMKKALDQGKPIIASMGPGIFTTSGHIIVFTGYTDKGFTVNDPNNYTRSATTYTWDQFGDQVRALWAMSAK